MNDYDYSLIEITKSEDGKFKLDASMFVENYWGAEGLAALDTAMRLILQEPFEEERVEEIRKRFGDRLVELRPQSKQSPEPEASTPSAEAEEELDLDLDLVEPKPEDKAPPGLDPVRVELVRTTMFALHSVVRGRNNRSHRAAGPVHHRFRQHVTPDQLRLVRGRPVAIPGAKVLANLGELQKKEAAHILEVRTLNGRCILNLQTLEIATSALSPPLVNRLPDSVVRDRNVGIGVFIPPFEGAAPVTPPAGAPESVAGIPPTIVKQQTPPPGAAPAPVPPGVPPVAARPPSTKKKRTA